MNLKAIFAVAATSLAAPMLTGSMPQIWKASAHFIEACSPRSVRNGASHKQQQRKNKKRK